MRRLLTTLCAVGALSFSSVAYAEPVPGFEEQYNSALASCTVPAGTVDACTAAINGYVAALVGAGVPLEQANISFRALRTEVRVRNAANPQFLAAIEALFEQLLPDSGAVGGGTPPAAGGGEADGGGDGGGTVPTPPPASPS